MKFQSIFHYVILLVVVVNGDDQQSVRNTGKLTPEENEKRLETCGEVKMERPSNDWHDRKIDKDAIWAAFANSKNSDKQNENGISMFTMISTRHFVTSSQVVMYDDKRWRWNGEPVVNNCPEIDLKVPREVLDQIYIYNKKCELQEPGDCPNYPTKLKEAYILNYCKLAGNNDTWHWGQAVMVVEIDDFFEHSTPCLEEGTTDIANASQPLDVYTYPHGWGTHHRILKVLDSTNWYIRFNKHHLPFSRGTPIMKIINDTETLIGLGAQGNGSITYAYRVSDPTLELCKLLGICGRHEILETTTPLPTTIPPRGAPVATRPALQAPPPYSEDKPKKPKRPYDDDDEEMEYLESDEDEDTDLLIGKDDLENFGEQGRLFVLFMGFWLLFWI